MFSIVLRSFNLTFTNLNPTRNARTLTLILALVLSLSVTFVGVLSPMSFSDAQRISEELREVFQYRQDSQAIFGSNFMICLGIFTPFLGGFFASISLYSTGFAIAALAMSSGVDPATSFFFFFLFPFFWMEYIAIALAMSQSFWLTLRILQRRSLKSEVINTCILITLCAIILILAAVIEIVAIQLI
jgi:hypothetical protein